MKRFNSFFILAFLLIGGRLAEAQEVRIAHASSLIPVIEKLKTKSSKLSNLQTVSIPGASGALAHQIVNGAPFDIYIAANPEYCKLLDEQNLSKKSEYHFLNGHLVLWTAHPLDTIGTQLSDAMVLKIASGESKTIAIADPDIAPYGHKAKDWLRANGILDAYSNDLVIGKNVTITNQYIATQSVDAAITSLSSKGIIGWKSGGNWYLLEDSDLTSVQHCTCLLSDTEESRKVFETLIDDSFLESIIQLGYSRHFIK